MSIPSNALWNRITSAMRAVYITLGVHKVPGNRHMLNALLQSAPYIGVQLAQLITRILFDVASNRTQRNTRDTLARVSLAVRYAFACHRRRPRSLSIGMARSALTPLAAAHCGSGWVTVSHDVFLRGHPGLLTIEIRSIQYHYLAGVYGRPLAATKPALSTANDFISTSLAGSRSKGIETFHPFQWIVGTVAAACLASTSSALTSGLVIGEMSLDGKYSGRVAKHVDKLERD